MKRFLIIMVSAILVFGTIDTSFAQQEPNDFEIDGTLPFGDIPTVYVLLRRSPGGDPLFDPEEIQLSAYYDTGASGIVFSRETRDVLGITIEPDAQFVDVGVGGEQIFEISEPLYISLADNDGSGDIVGEGQFHAAQGPWRFQLTIDEVGGFPAQPIDVVGIPAMAGKSIVMTVDTIDFLGMDIPYYITRIMEPNNPAVPEMDIEVKVQFTDFLYNSHPGNTGPLPVLSYNPVIEDIQIGFGTGVSVGNWLLDTGAQLSMISTIQGQALGLMDSSGEPLIDPEFYQPLGGIGGEIEAPVFIIDYMAIPTVNGFDLRYKNVYVAVFDIGTIDERTGQPLILDGIFGTNLLGYSYNMNLDIVLGPYDSIVLDTQRAVLGFDVNIAYTVPPSVPDRCGSAGHPWLVHDINRDCCTDVTDFVLLLDEWLSDDCSILNWNCAGCDLDRDGYVTLEDIAAISQHWLDCTR